MKYSTVSEIKDVKKTDRWDVMRTVKGSQTYFPPAGVSSAGDTLHIILVGETAGWMVCWACPSRTCVCLQQESGSRFRVRCVREGQRKVDVV